MNYYGYITDNTYVVPNTAITWNFTRYNEDGSTTDFIGIESTIGITSDKVTMFESAMTFNSWKYEYKLEEI